MASKLVSTNIIDIIGGAKLPTRSLMFKYKFCFNKNKYNPFEYNYLYFRKIGVLEMEFSYKQEDKIGQNSYEEDNDVNESERIYFNNKIIYNSNQNVICSNYSSNRLTIKVNISYIRATQKCKINQLPSQTHISIDEQKEFESNLKRQQFQSQIITK